MPTPTCDADRKVLDDVARYGWHVVSVQPLRGEEGPGWHFTIGLHRTLGHPELVVFGLAPDDGTRLLNDLGQDVRRGERFEPGRAYGDLLEGRACEFRDVRRLWHGPFLGYATWFYDGAEFPVRQLAWSDTHPLLSEATPRAARAEVLLRSMGFALRPWWSRALARLGLALALLALLGCRASAATPAVKDGDLVFQTSRSSQSQAIQRATHSKYSHMGVVLLRHGKPFVFEAVQTVRYTPLEKWLARGEGGHYVVRRLRQPLDAPAAEKLRAAAEPFAGKAYDLTFEWSDARIYCSELVWKMYERALGIELGPLAKLRSFDLDDPLVRAKMRERYGDHVPLDEPVIAPRAMFDSELLVTVAEH